MLLIPYARVSLEDALIREILKVTKLITTLNYFSFHDKTYLQNGLAMDAPMSSILSEIYLNI